MTNRLEAMQLPINGCKTCGAPADCKVHSNPDTSMSSVVVRCINCEKRIGSTFTDQDEAEAIIHPIVATIMRWNSENQSADPRTAHTMLALTVSLLSIYQSFLNNLKLTTVIIAGHEVYTSEMIDLIHNFVVNDSADEVALAKALAKIIEGVER